MTTPPARRPGAGLGEVTAACALRYIAGMMLRLTMVLALAACSGEPAKPVKTKQQRMAEAEAVLSKTPASRVYRIDGNELRVIDVPVLGLLGSVEHQRCFVWRDVEFRAATLSCGQMPDIHVSGN